MFEQTIAASGRVAMPGFSARYRNTMGAVWRFPTNDQRPAVLAALCRWCGQGRSILDVGAGDGYYLADLAPRLVTAVEPDRVFRGLLLTQSGSLGCSVRTFATIDGLRERLGEDWDADLILMVHVLYYLDEPELRWLLARVGQRDLVLVYPDPAAAVTAEFEGIVGSDRSRRRVEIKSAMLGEPQQALQVDSHFRLPPDTPEEDLAFLVAHTLLRDKQSRAVMQQAGTFVADRVDYWRRDGFLELPQPQVMEFYRGAVATQSVKGTNSPPSWSGPSACSNRDLGGTGVGEGLSSAGMKPYNGRS